MMQSDLIERIKSRWQAMRNQGDPNEHALADAAASEAITALEGAEPVAGLYGEYTPISVGASTASPPSESENPKLTVVTSGDIPPAVSPAVPGVRVKATCSYPDCGGECEECRSEVISTLPSTGGRDDG